MPKTMTPQQREILLEWLNSLKDPFTIEDVAQRFSVHYQTSRDWIQELKDAGLLEVYPFRKGRKLQYVISVNGSVTAVGDPDDASIKIAFGVKQVTLSEYANAARGAGVFPNVSYALAYMYVRSYYADMPEHQHLRGITPTVEVRAYVAECLAVAERHVDALKQMLAYSAPWVEGPELGRRFGQVEDLIGIQEVAAQFDAAMQTRKGQSHA